MRDVYKDEDLAIPEGVTVSIKSRVITVEGPRGKLVKVSYEVEGLQKGGA